MKSRLYRAFILGTIGVFGILAGPILAIAATTIGTDISTGGNLTVTGTSTLSGPVNLGDPNAGGGGWNYGKGFNITNSLTEGNSTEAVFYSQANPTADVNFQDTADFYLDFQGSHNYLNGGSALSGSVEINSTGSVGRAIDPVAATFGTADIDTAASSVYSAGVRGQSQIYAGTAAQLTGVWGWLGLYGGNVTNASTFYAEAPSGGGTTPANLFQYWSDDIAGVATNPYYSWFDSRGVRRVKEDSAFNGTGQAIEALYNNQFTKYTPGTSDYERLVLGEWNGSNVAEIGTENGGTGTARALAFITANTARMTIGADGNVAIGVPSSAVPLQVATSTNNATSTVTIGKTGQNKGSCLVMYDATGAVKYLSIQGGSLVVSNTTCQ